MQLALIIATVGSTTAASCKGSGVSYKQPLAMGPSTSRPLLPRSLEVVSLAMQSPASPLAMWALTLHFESVTVPLSFSAKPSFPWNFCYEVSVWNFRDWRDLPSRQ